MKRFKSMGLSLCAIILAAVIFFGGGGFSTLVLADLRSGSDPFIFSGAVVREVELGKNFEVPSENGTVIEVTAPNGRPAAIQNNLVFADQLGNYTVEVTNTITDTTYSYNVYCSQSYEYNIYVDFDGAKIPTYMATNGTFVVPHAFLGFTNDDGELEEFDLPAAGVENQVNGFVVSATGAKATITKNTDGTLTVKPTERGTMILRYSASLSGKHYSKEYTITVQDDFVNESKPRISVVNVPLTANLNTKVTLPIATATSASDDRVYVEVIVTHANFPDGRVVVMRDDEIDEDTGYARPTVNENRNYRTDNDPVEFDNVRTMSFYATEPGEYKVTYQAFNSDGVPSTLHDYYIQCDDGLAPVFVDFDRHDIPTNWGLNVTRSATAADGSSVEPEVDPAILLPIPDVKDNADDYKDLSVSLRITDPIGRTVLRFTNILNVTAEQAGEGKNGHIAAENSKYAPDGGAAARTFGVDGFRFDFNEYNVDLSEKIGTYTFEYRVSDSKGRGRTFSPSITLSLTNSFEDINAPQISLIDTVRYILLGTDGDETLVIPTAEVSDDFDSNPTIIYELTFDDGTTAVTETLEKATTLDIIEEGGKFFLVDDKDFKLEVGNGDITLSVTAIDDVGNVSEPVTANIASYLLSDKSQTALNLVSGLKTGTLSRIEEVNGVDRYLNEVMLGSFRIEGATDARFAGFEVVMKTPNNAIIEVSLERMVVDDVIYVNNVSFVPVTTGSHDLYIRVFDVKGESKLYMFTFNITGDINNDIPLGGNVAPRNAAMPTTGGSINTKYALKGNPTQTLKNYSVVRVSGNSFSLIGNDFIANAPGGYKIEEFYIDRNNCQDLNAGYDRDDLIRFQTYNTTIGTSEKPVIEILGDMPAHSAKSTIDTNKRYETTGVTMQQLLDAKWVVLPSISAFNSNANAEVEVKVTDRTSQPVQAYKLYQSDNGPETLYGFYKETEVPQGYYFANIWAFAPITDGAHTVTISAKLDGSDNSSVHTILIGKIAGPSFVVDSTVRKAFSIGAEFNFFKISQVTDPTMEQSQIDAYTYVKRLIDPSGNTVVEIKGNDRVKYSEMTDNNGTSIKLEMSGTYTEVYEVIDTYGNKTTIRSEFQVNAKSRGATSSMKMLSTILIIVAVLLLAGAVFYVVRFRKVKRIER